MGYFDDWFEGEMNLDIDELSFGDRIPDPLDGDTATDSSFEEDYFDNIDRYWFNTDPTCVSIWTSDAGGPARKNCNTFVTKLYLEL